MLRQEMRPQHQSLFPQTLTLCKRNRFWRSSTDHPGLRACYSCVIFAPLQNQALHSVVASVETQKIELFRFLHFFWHFFQKFIYAFPTSPRSLLVLSVFAWRERALHLFWPEPFRLRVSFLPQSTKMLTCDTEVLRKNGVTDRVQAPQKPLNCWFADLWKLWILRKIELKFLIKKFQLGL